LATAPFNIFAVAAPGLEPIVAGELRALGEKPRVEDGGVSWRGDARSVMRANLWLRTATRVLVRMAKFHATSFAELERNAKRVPWERFVGPGREVEFAVTAKKSKLIHTTAIAERLANAVKAKARDARPKTQDPGSTQMFVVRVVRDEFEISADSSGELLHMRGYRQAVGKAPIRETLAAALLIAADWKGETPLIDPFCGSGTIPIEAALMARRIAPGFNRSFAILGWPGMDLAAWTTLYKEAKQGVLPASPVVIFGSDRDKGAIAASIANAERAGVAADITFTQRAISAIEPPVGASGLLATNPPYGVRASPKADVRNLYAQMGNVVREKLPGWRVALYSAQPRLTAELRMETTESFRTTNGGIKVAAVLGAAIRL
jgi:putative N6-adenine-specific DNA methylase